MKKNIYILIGLAALIILGMIIALAVFLRPQGTLSIAVNPSDARFEIAGKVYNGTAQKVSLKQGQYKVTFERALFLTKKMTLQVKGGKENTYQVRLEIDPQAEKKYNELTDGEKTVIDQYYDRQTRQDIQQITAEHPILTSLPYIKVNQYRIDYGFSNETTVFFDITIDRSIKEPEAVKEEIKKWFAGKKVDITKYKVNYYYENLN